MIKKFYLLTNLLFIYIYSFSQTGSISGFVVDKTTGEPLPFVNIAVLGSTTGTSSDINGYFIIKDLPDSIIKLKASFIGYTLYESENIQLGNASAINLIIELEPAYTQLDEVVIKAFPDGRSSEALISMRKINVKEFRTNPGANGDLSKVIQTFPGVSTGSSFRNDIMVRGGGPAENVFYLDEIELPTINHFQTQGASGGTHSIINSEQIVSMDFYSGAFPADKSNALSSVIGFKLKDDFSERPLFRFSVGASEVALSSEGRAGKKSGYLFSVRRSYLKYLYEALELPFLPTFNDYQLKWKTRINKNNEIKLISIGAYDQFRLNKDIKDPDPQQEYVLNFVPESNQWNYTIGAVYKHFGGNAYQTIVLSRSKYNNASTKYENNDPELAVTFDYQSQETENKLRFEQTGIFNNFQYSFSLNTAYVQYYSRSYNPIFVYGNVIEYNSKSYIDFYKWGGSFSFIQTALKGRMKIVFGIRTDANSFSKKMSDAMRHLSPRISARYTINTKLSVTASLGRYYRLPAYTTLGHRDQEGLLVNKNENIDYIRSDQAITGLEYMLRENIVFTVEGFYKKYDNYPVSILDSVNLATKGSDFGVYGIGPVFSDGKGRAYGIEISNRTTLKNKLNITASYTYYYSEMEDKNGNNIPTNWDNRHLILITSTYQFNRNWSAGVKWRFAGGAPYTPYDLELSSMKVAWDTQNQPFMDWNRVNSERFSSFHQLDVRVDKQFHFKNWMLNLYLDIQNVYNFKSQQPDYVIRQKDGRGNYIISTDDQGIENYRLQNIQNLTGTILPTFGIVIEF